MTSENVLCWGWGVFFPCDRNHKGHMNGYCWELGTKKNKTKEKKCINNGGHVNLPDELYFGIWVLFWYLVLPFGRNPLHAQHDILCDQSFRPVSIFICVDIFSRNLLFISGWRKKESFNGWAEEEEKKNLNGKKRERKIVFVNKFRRKNIFFFCYQQHKSAL